MIMVDKVTKLHTGTTLTHKIPYDLTKGDDIRGWCICEV